MPSRAPFAACLFFSVLVCAIPGAAQQKHQLATALANSSVQGTITVTCTVSASVGLVEGSDGELHIVVANGIDPADNVSNIRYVQLKKPVNSNQAKSISPKEDESQERTGTAPR